MTASLRSSAAEDIPVNACGNGIDVVGVLKPAAADTCVSQ
ncbi:chaplin family protein [Streptomyces sp. NPDC048521]